MVKAKGYEFNVPKVTSSHSRRALQYKNKIIATLARLGLTEYDVEVELEPMAIKRLPASASWYFDDAFLNYSFSTAGNYAENLYVVFKVIEQEVDQVLAGTLSKEEFVHRFTEDDDVSDQRRKARETLGVAADETNMEIISKAYKKLAKELHPDTEGGDTEKFKAVNRAHKILKRELE